MKKLLLIFISIKLFAITYEEYIIKNYSSYATIVFYSTSKLEDAKKVANTKRHTSIFKVAKDRFLITYGIYKTLLDAKRDLVLFSSYEGAYIQTLNSFFKTYLGYVKISNKDENLFILIDNLKLYPNTQLDDKKYFEIVKKLALFKLDSDKKIVNKVDNKVKKEKQPVVKLKKEKSNKEIDKENKLITTICKRECQKECIKQNNKIKNREKKERIELLNMVLNLLSKDINQKDLKIREIMTPPKYNTPFDFSCQTIKLENKKNRISDDMLKLLYK